MSAGTVKRKYDLSAIEGIALTAAKLPAELETSLTSKGYTTIDAVYGAMVGTPDILRRYLEQFAPLGVEYDSLLEHLKRFLSPERIRELEQPRKPVRKGGVIRP